MSVSQSKVSIEATMWLIRIKTSRYLEEFWPAFEEWLYSAQAHWDAYVQVEKGWFELEWLKTRGR